MSLLGYSPPTSLCADVLYVWLQTQMSHDIEETHARSCSLTRVCLSDRGAMGGATFFPQLQSAIYCFAWTPAEVHL